MRHSVTCNKSGAESQPADANPYDQTQIEQFGPLDFKVIDRGRGQMTTDNSAGWEAVAGEFMIIRSDIGEAFARSWARGNPPSSAGHFLRFKEIRQRIGLSPTTI